MAETYSADSDLEIEEEEEEEEEEEIEEEEEEIEDSEEWKESEEEESETAEYVNSSLSYCGSGESQEIGQSKMRTEEAEETEEETHDEEVVEDGEDKGRAEQNAECTEVNLLLSLRGRKDKGRVEQNGVGECKQQNFLPHLGDCEGIAPPKTRGSYIPLRSMMLKPYKKVRGVPRDGGKLLFGYKHSWAATIYSTKDHRNACRFLRAQPALSAKKKWKLDTEADAVVALVKESGLFTAVINSVVKYDSALVSAFAERYYAETDTLHFPFGEMTLTPDDVHHILGLNVGGKAVNEGYVKVLDWDKLYALTMKVFDWDLETAKSELRLGKGNARVFNLKRLRSKFEGTKVLELKGQLTEKRIIATATAYLMYILGRVIFPDTSGSRVNANYLQLLDPLSRVSSYSWGTACLSFLMNELRKTSRLQKDQIGGNVGLLQVWIYVHFPCFSSRASRKKDSNGRYPIGARYMVNGKRKSKKLDLIALREHLDKMKAQDVTFDPYSNEITECKICRTNEQIYFGPLFHPHGYVMYNPTRVWRQLGFVQDIPFDSFHNHWSLDLTKCESSEQRIVVVHDPVPSSADWEKRSGFYLPAGYPVSRGDEVSPNYMNWYCRVSHTQVIRNEPGTSEPDRISKAIETLKKGSAHFTTISSWAIRQREEINHLIENLINECGSTCEKLNSKRTGDSKCGPDKEEGDQGRLAKRMRG